MKDQYKTKDELIKEIQELQQENNRLKAIYNNRIAGSKATETGLKKYRTRRVGIIKAEEEVDEFAENIINTLREPLLVLDQDLRVVKASRSFYNFFKVTAGETVGKLIYDLGNNQWDIPKLKELLETILPEKATFDDYEVEHNFSTIGKRIMLLNARQIKRAFGKEKIILLAIEDITERKLVEESLSEKSRMTSEYLDILLDHSHAPIIIWDSSMVIKRFNHEFEKLSGYKSAEVIDKKIDILFPKDKTDSTLELLNKHLSDEKLEVIEVDILTKDKDIRTVLWNSAHILDKEGKSTVATIAQDITRRKRTEEALRISEEKYRGIFENILDVYYVASIDGTILEVSPSIEIVSKGGYHRDDLIGKSMNDFYPITNGRQTLLALLHERGSVSDYEIILKNRDGSNVPCSISAKIQFDANYGPLKIIGSMRDITERKKMEEVLRTSETHLRTLVQTIPDLIWLKDPDGVYLSCNTMFERFFGAREADIIGKTDYNFVDQELAGFFRENDRKAMEAGKPTSNEEWVTFADDGHQACLETIKTPMYNSNGILLGVLGIGRDITDRKNADESLKKQKDEFETIFNLVPAQIWYKDTHNNFIRVNRQVCIDIGMTNDQIEGHSAEELFPSFAQQYFMDDLEVINARKPKLGITEQVNTANGEIRWVHSDKIPVFGNDGEVNGIIAFVQDITERKLAEESLQESEASLNLALQSAGMSVWHWDIIEDRRYFDNQVCYLLGINPITFTGDAEEFFGAVHPDDRQTIKMALARTIEKDVLYEMEYRVVWPDESIHYIAARGRLSRNDKGTPAKMNGTIWDITESKQKEEILLKLKKAVDNSGEVIFLTDKDGIFTFINPAFTSIYGFTADEIVGKVSPRILKSGLMEENDYKLFWETLQSRKEVRGELINKRKDGTSITIESTSSPIFDENKNIIGFLGIQRDITERKQTEEALQESEIKFRSITEQTTDLIAITDANGFIIYASPASKTLFHYTPEEMCGHHFSEFIDETTVPEAIAGFNTTLRSDERMKLERRMKRKDGSIFIGELNRSNYQCGELNGVLVIIRDITERKQAEIELIKAKNKAEQSDRLKTAFLTNMSHEIRTPLNGILGFTDLLKEPKLSGEEQQEYINIIEKSGKRMLNIISDIISISIVESGNLKTSIAAADVNKQIEFLLTFFRPEAMQKGLGIYCTKKLPPNESVILTDKEKVNSILSNLIKNAIKFTPTGSIEFGCEKKGQYLEYYVKDTGTGIVEEKMEIIFERFRQGSESNTRNYEGAGLGLSISKAYVKVLGGKIWVESEEGKGSTFYFNIPYQAVPEEKIVKKNAVSAYEPVNQPRKLKILIAEDDETSELLIRIVVRIFSDDILEAATGIEAIEVCRNNPDIDLVLMDVKMPDMDGLEATMQIRQFNKEVIIIAQTAYSLDGDKEIALEAGCNDYISKPIDIIVLKGLIEKYFYQKEGE